jgi:hypothetical protein
MAFNRNWNETRWQQYSTHLRTNNTQNTNPGESLNTQMESFAVFDSQGSRNLTFLLLPFFVTHSKYGIKKIKFLVYF